MAQEATVLVVLLEVMEVLEVLEVLLPLTKTLRSSKLRRKPP